MPKVSQLGKVGRKILGTAVWGSVKGEAMELSFGKTVLSGISLLDNLLSFQNPFLLLLVPQDHQEPLLAPFLAPFFSQLNAR